MIHPSYFDLSFSKNSSKKTHIKVAKNTTSWINFTARCTVTVSSRQKSFVIAASCQFPFWLQSIFFLQINLRCLSVCFSKFLKSYNRKGRQIDLEKNGSGILIALQVLFLLSTTSMIMRTTPLRDISNLSVTEFLISFPPLSTFLFSLFTDSDKSSKKGKCALSMSPNKPRHKVYLIYKSKAFGNLET